MITGFILTIIYYFIAFLVGLLPLGSDFPASWVVAVNQIWGYINAFSFIVPVSTLVYVLGIAISFHLFIFAWKVIHWVLSLIRGSRVH